MTSRPGFYVDERCFWHGGGNYAEMLPAGGLVEPMSGGLPETPGSKRRLKNLAERTGLLARFEVSSAPDAKEGDLRRVHTSDYLSAFKALSEAGGGELGLRAPFLPGGYEIAAQSAGLVTAALEAVLDGRHPTAYALARPPGHHCLPATPMGFCLLANIAIAVEAALAAGRAEKIAVVDWDVHHGNGTEAIFLDRPEVLTLSLHQERNFPLDTGGAEVRGTGAGKGANVNIPLPPGTGHAGYLAAFDRCVAPALTAFRPEVIVVACGFDAAALDPLGRMLCHSGTFGALTRRTLGLAQDLCGGKLMLAHEGGYSEAYVPFCGHAVLEALAPGGPTAPDPLLPSLKARQPGPAFDRFLDAWLTDLADALDL